MNVPVPEIMDFRHETLNSHKSRKTSTFWRTGKQCDISVWCGHNWFPNETGLFLWRILEQMKVYSNRNVINDKTKWNDIAKLKNWISQELLKIKGWGFQHSTCYDSGHLLRWFTMVFAVFDIFPVICPWCQQQLSLASINGIVCHCLWVLRAPSTWSPRPTLSLYYPYF